MKFQLSANTHVGKVRDHNEDNFFVCSNLTNDDWSFDKSIKYDLGKLGTVLIVADGMGGMNAGEVASEIAVDISKSEFSNKAKEVDLFSENSIDRFIKETIVNAHNAILAHHKSHPETQGMGTTLIIGWIINGIAHVGWCGDSRAYIFNPLLKSSGRAKAFEEEGLRVKENLALISKDHSYVQTLVDKGELTDSQAFFHPESNIITQSLGQVGMEIQPSVTSLPIYSGDKLILCSDGINAMLEDGDIAEICESNTDASETSKALITQANEKGGHDNSTITIFHATQADEGLIDPLAQAIKLDLSQQKKKPVRYVKYVALAVLIGVTVASFLFPNKTAEQILILNEPLLIGDTLQLYAGDTLYYKNEDDRSAVSINIEDLKLASNIDTSDLENVLSMALFVNNSTSAREQDDFDDISSEVIEETQSSSINTEVNVESKSPIETKQSNSLENTPQGLFRIRLCVTKKYPSFSPEQHANLDLNKLIVVHGSNSNFITYYGDCSSSRMESEAILKTLVIPDVEPEIDEVLECIQESIKSPDILPTLMNEDVNTQEEQSNNNLTPIETEKDIVDIEEAAPDSELEAQDVADSQIKKEDSVNNIERATIKDTSDIENSNNPRVKPEDGAMNHK